MSRLRGTNRLVSRLDIFMSNSKKDDVSVSFGGRAGDVTSIDMVTKAVEETVGRPQRRLCSRLTLKTRAKT